jgi:hypothetical protein
MTKSKRVFFVMMALVLSVPIASVSAFAGTCSGAVPKCIANSPNNSDAPQRCKAAGAACMKTGVFVAPYSGTPYKEDKK